MGILFSAIIAFVLVIIGFKIGSLIVPTDFKGFGLDALGSILSTIISFGVFAITHIKLRPIFSEEGKNDKSDWFWLIVSLILSAMAGYISHKILV